MHQILLPVTFTGGPECTLSEGEFHHLIRVLRHKEGDAMPAMDAAGGRYQTVITRITKESCTLSVWPLVCGTGGTAPAEPCSIRLYQCVPKGKTMDTVVRKAVEAGAREITPVLSKNTVPEYKNSDQGKKVLRWRAIADAAMEQSCVLVPVKVGDIIGIDAIEAVPIGDGSKAGLVFHEKKLSDTSLHRLLSGPVTEIFLVIGPEGGLTSEELEILIKKGYHIVHLGPRILKTDTASLFAIAAVQSILLEKESWSVRL